MWGRARKEKQMELGKGSIIKQQSLNRFNKRGTKTGESWLVVHCYFSLLCNDATERII